MQHKISSGWLSLEYTYFTAPVVDDEKIIGLVDVRDFAQVILDIQSRTKETTDTSIEFRKAIAQSKHVSSVFVEKILSMLKNRFK